MIGASTAATESVKITECPFRYFVFEGTVLPEINYLCEVVDELMRRIEEEVSKRPTQGLASAVFKWTVSKPEKK